jgi:membrane-associated protein
VLDGIFDALRDFAESLGPFSILALSALDTIGLPASGDIAVITAAALRSYPFGVIVLMGFIGALIGDHVAYWAGRTGGKPLIRRLLGEKRHESLSEHMHKHAPLVLVFGRSIAGIRTKAAVLAGAAHLDYRRFCLWNVLGCAIWAVAFTFIGRLLGDVVDFEELLPKIGEYTLLGVVALLVIGGGWFWLRRRRRPPPEADPV